MIKTGIAFLQRPAKIYDGYGHFIQKTKNTL